jgi:RNA polymerase sigma-70 factor, ECF subfamily
MRSAKSNRGTKKEENMSVLSLRTNAEVKQEASPSRLISKPDLLENLWQRHARHVYTTALRLLADVNEAEAITAKVFQRAYQRVPDQPDDERRILLALTVDCSLRRLREQQRLLAPDISDDQTLIISAATSQSAYPVDLETHLLQLPDYWRVVFVLHDVMGLSHGEIAAYLRTGEAYVRRVVHRARLALRKALLERKQDS